MHSSQTLDVESADTLEPFPAAALKLYETCNQPQPDVKKVIKLIESDPVFALEVLALANSPVYGCSHNVTTIQQGVVVLGLNCVTKMGLTIASKSVFLKDGSSQVGNELYGHSLACGIIARQIVQSNSKADANTALLAGLIHDVGKMVFIQCASDTYLSSKSDGQKVDSVATESELFGINHPTLGERYATRMGLPAVIVRAIANHHVSDESDPLTQSIQLANQLAKHWYTEEAELPNHLANLLFENSVNDIASFEQTFRMEFEAMFSGKKDASAN